MDTSFTRLSRLKCHGPVQVFSDINPNSYNSNKIIHKDLGLGIVKNTTVKQNPVKLINDKKRDVRSFNAYITNDDKVQSANEYNESIPDSIDGSYKYDFNIMDIHNIILKKFNYDKSNKIHQLKIDIENEMSRMDSRQNIVERKASLKIIEKLDKTINNILSDDDYNTYLEDIRPVIENYNLIGTLSKIVSFATNKHDSDSEDEIPESCEIQDKRQNIIYDFIEIAREYIEINLIRDVKEGNSCVCGFKLDDVEPSDIDEGVIVCPNCNIEKISVVRSRFYADNSRTNNSGNNYEDRANFEKVLMRYQGKQSDKPPDDLYKALELYFIRKKIPKISLNGQRPIYCTSEIIRNNINRNSNGEKDGTSRSLMYKALQDTGNSKYYDHINIVLNNVWGWELHDITHLEDSIMDDYDKSQEVYEILPKDRKSSLNSQFRLFKHLRRLIGFKIKSQSFRIPTTHDIIEFHENIWAKICEILEWDNL